MKLVECTAPEENAAVSLHIVLIFPLLTLYLQMAMLPCKYTAAYSSSCTPGHVECTADTLHLMLRICPSLMKVGPSFSILSTASLAS